MPAFGSVVAADGEATPVNHTFVPVNIVGPVVNYVESTGVPVADKRLTTSITKTADKGRNKISVRLAWPIVQDETVNGIVNPVVVRTAHVDMVATFDPTSSEQERKNVIYTFKNAIFHAQVLDQLYKLSSVY